MENYGLVLAGGGCKGVYQIGVWRALRELHIPITAVVGTSVGAMNGALVALDAYEGAVDLWLNMSIEKGFALPEPLRVPDRLFSLKNADILVKELWKNKGLDMSPLRRRLEALIDEDALRRSPVEYGLVTFEVKRRQGRHLYRDQIPKGRLMDYIMASSAYPGIKRPEMDGKIFLDGGVVDNLPVKMLLRRHPDHIIAVDIGDSGLPAGLDPSLDIRYIQPVEPLGHAFEFQPDTAALKMETGWYDGMKAFDKFAGDWLYFAPEEYRRMQRELGEDTVRGLEYAARLYGMDKLRVMEAVPFARELLECDRLSAQRYGHLRAATDVPRLLRDIYREGFRHTGLTRDMQLQLVQGLVDDESERPRVRALAGRLFPDTLRAAEAVIRLRRYMGGDD